MNTGRPGAWGIHRVMRRNGPGRAGYTLVELVTVIVLLTLVGVFIGGPTLSLISSMRSRTAGARTAADIRYIQRLAMSSRNSTWIAFNSAQNRYQLYVENPASPGKAGRVALRHPLDQTTTPVQFGTGQFASVTLSSASINSTQELEFDSFGVPYDANGTALPANGTISFNNSVTVTVRPVSGLVE